MADKKISELSAAGALSGTELVELVQAGANVRSTVSAVGATAAAAAITTHEADTTAVHGITDTSTLYRSGGTDVAVADGGTGSSTASAARTALDVPSNAEAVLDTLVDAKGDLLTGTANDTPARLAVGGIGTRLQADPSTATGLAWATVQPLAPTGAIGQTYDRNGPTFANQAAALVSGTLKMVALELPAGATITNIVWVSGTTALSGGTNWWFGLFDSSRVALRLTADQTSAAWAASTAKSVAMSSTFVTTYTGLHYIGCMVAASTVPSLVVSASAVGTALGIAPILSGAADTGQTTPPGLPFTATALTASGSYPYAFVT